MLQRLYVDNFRCLENFEFTPRGSSSALLIGKNGTGKSTIAHALSLFQSIGRCVNRVDQLIQVKDFSAQKFNIPIQFEIEILLENKVYKYILLFELSEGPKELQVLKEKLLVSGKSVFSRNGAKVILTSQNRDDQFLVDRHLIALPIIRKQSQTNSIHIFKAWLERITILAPVPSLMTGNSSSETSELKRDGSNFGAWFLGLSTRHSTIYKSIRKYLQAVSFNLIDMENKSMSKEFMRVNAHFANCYKNLTTDFDRLSNEEKCTFLCASVFAASRHCDPFLCFWDEPENYVSLSEIIMFSVLLKSNRKEVCQLLLTSCNEESVRGFPPRETFLLDRKSNLEPTSIRSLSTVLAFE